MDNEDLKQILRDQKEPLDEAVHQKLSYLKSSKVFDLDGPYTSNFSLEMNTDQQKSSSIEEAFEMVSKVVHSNPQTRQIVEPEPQNRMSVTEKIAALRGAAGAPSSCLGYQRKKLS